MMQPCPAQRDASTDPSLSPSSAKVYLYLLGCLQFTVWTPRKTVAIAQTLELSRETVRTALRELAELEYIDMTESDDGRVHAYRLVFDRRSHETIVPKIPPFPVLTA